MSERELKYDFTPIEIQRIKDLINQKNATKDQNDQKRIRDKIRKIGFYAEDHGIKKGQFTVENFLKAINQKPKSAEEKFWHLQMNQGLTDGLRIDFDRVRSIIENDKIIGTAEWDDKQCRDFKDAIKIGDIVMVREGLQPIALVKVTGENVQSKIYENQRSIHVLGYFDQIIENRIGTYNGQSRGTLEPVNDRNTKTGKFIIGWYNLIAHEMEHEDIINLLTSKKQIILQGPPGTGKTYTAKDLAEKLIYGSLTAKSDQKTRLENTDQFKMIQFHPAYSYEDFVRGIEAKANGNQVEYKTVNRVLTEMANEALENHRNSKKSGEELSEERWLDDAFLTFAEKIQDDIESKEGKFFLEGTTTYLKLVEADCFRYTGDNWGYEAGNRMAFQDLKEMYRQGIKSRMEIKKMSGVSGLAIQHASYYIKVLDLFYQFLDTGNVEKKGNFTIQEKPFVLVIDEINRANLPSVLGELIYALEYRGEAVESMYEKEAEGRKIILPPNLYIIGTMNTADRSVGHIDYAIRRRFAFVDILPNPDPIKDFAQLKFKSVSDLFIANFNEYFSNTDVLLKPSIHLSSDFRPEDVWIGHSYFITKSDGEEGENELMIKMKYEVIPLLKEYIKDGILIETEELKKLISQL